MIDIVKITDNDVGREVGYQVCEAHPPHGACREYGKITSWNDTFIFVDYRGNGYGVATRPEDLDFTQAT